MPLASPSSLTSNTLATFLDHVPISTNNAEKWKPKQMGSNRGGDYWVLSRALSAPLGTERWILHRLFVNNERAAWGQTAVTAICLHVTELFTARFICHEEWMLRIAPELFFEFPFFYFFICYMIFFITTSTYVCKASLVGLSVIVSCSNRSCWTRSM